MNRYLNSIGPDSSAQQAELSTSLALMRTLPAVILERNGFKTNCVIQLLTLDVYFMALKQRVHLSVFTLAGREN